MVNRFLVFGLLALAGIGPASAQIALEGSFTASKACPALQSIKKGSNPGNVMVQAGASYRLHGQNSEAATHYFIDVPGAQPERRWIAADCGRLDGAPASGASAPPAPAQAKPSPYGNSYVLAISWQPAFCEGRPGKRECRRQTEQSFEASRFTLHGLWPQPRRRVFCNVERRLIDADNESRWDELPAVELKPETRTELDTVMPGTQSQLDRHEWIKHGTCYPGGGAEQYYADSLKLMRAINSSAVQKLVAARVGREVTGRDVRAAFDETFGRGAGDRVRLACKPDGNRNLIVEITIGLKGDIAASNAVGDLIRASEPTDPGCPRGIVDPVGLQ